MHQICSTYMSGADLASIMFKLHETCGLCMDHVYCASIMSCTRDASSAHLKLKWHRSCSSCIDHVQLIDSISPVNCTSRYLIDIAVLRLLRS